MEWSSSTLVDEGISIRLRPVCLVYWMGAARMSRGFRVTELPSGTVTFLFTDIEGSTRLWEKYPRAMTAALARHDEILRAAVEP